MLLIKNYLLNVRNYYDVIFSSGVLCIIFILLFPIPAVIIDLLLSLSITFSILILIVVLLILRPLDFNSFPSVLLLTTILRLALNIASTRLILSDGHLATSSAGYIIESFGKFVMHGSVMIGVIVFIILTIVNFVVITKGSGRIAEVSARFSLDSMPGKQMAIDAELSAGIINDEIAKSRRKELEAESTFFGAMDGASKFVRGDAIAGILITFINFIGGMVIGILTRGMSFDNAIHKYTILTIGDGLVSQIPAIIISVAAGLLVTKSGVIESTDKAIFSQVAQHPKALVLTGVFLMIISLIPGIPFIPFFITSSGAMFLAYTSVKKDNNTINKEDVQKKSDFQEEESKKIRLDAIKLELGSRLLVFVAKENNTLPNSIQQLRKQIINDLGFIIPSVHIQDNFLLQGNQYVLKIKDIECAKGEVYTDKMLIMSPNDSVIDLPGKIVTEPVFGLPAVWIEESLKEEAQLKNYTVIEPKMVIITHIAEVIKDNIAELVTYNSVQKLLNNIDDEHKLLISDLVPSQVSISIIQKVLEKLLAENISIKDLSTIIESIADNYRINQNINTVVEAVRARLSRQISHYYSVNSGYIPVITLSAVWEKVFIDGIHNDNLAIPSDKLEEFIRIVKKTFEYNLPKEENLVLLTNSLIRSYVRYVIERIDSKIPVISQNEIHAKYKIKVITQVMS